MEFKTKINLSNNIFVKQDKNTVTNFDGINIFCVPLNERRLGPNLEKVTKTSFAKNVKSSFIYNKDENTFEFKFGEEKMNSSIDSILNENITPQTEDTYNIDPVYEGINPYYVDSIEFFEQYQGYEFDMEFEIIDENENFVIGNIYTNEINLCVAESKDYVGEDDVVIVDGNLKTKFVKSSKAYDVIEVDGDTVLSPTSNIIYKHIKGEISLPTNPSIGWNAFIYLESENINIEKIDHTLGLGLTEIIFIGNKFITK